MAQPNRCRLSFAFNHLEVSAEKLFKESLHSAAAFLDCRLRFVSTGFHVAQRPTAVFRYTDLSFAVYGSDDVGAMYYDRFAGEKIDAAARLEAGDRHPFDAADNQRERLVEAKLFGRYRLCHRAVANFRADRFCQER